MRWWAVAATVLLLAGACSDDDEATPARSSAGVVVASFDFAESRVLAELYAQALEDEGVEVSRQLDLGDREQVLPALHQGLVDVVPEYAGSALDVTSPAASPSRAGPVATARALAAALEAWDVEVLEPSDATNQNVLAVPAGLAADHDLEAVSDLAPLAGSLALGGPPECERRPRCLLGLVDVYGLAFERFVPLAGEQLVQRALADGVVDVGVLFSTDAVLANGELVVLADDRDLQPSDNVVPLARTEALRDDRVRPALDEVSGQLTTSNLRFLNWRVAQPGASVQAEARAWLIRRGLIDR